MRDGTQMAIVIVIIVAAGGFVLFGPDYAKKDRDELFFLLRERGYCAALVDYGVEKPAKCQDSSQQARAERMNELRMHLKLQPVFRGEVDTTPDRLPKPAGI